MARGMTLLEILVAALIALIIMSILFPLVVRTMRFRSRAEEGVRVHGELAGALSILRRDLECAFKATQVYQNEVVAGFSFEAEDTDHPGTYRRIRFLTASDGWKEKANSGLGYTGDPLREYEYNQAAWCAVGGALVRRVGPELVITLKCSEAAALGWRESPHQDDPDPENRTFYDSRYIYYPDGGPTVDDPGPFKGLPYIRTDSLQATSEIEPSTRMQFKDNNSEPVPVLVTICFNENRDEPIPNWVSMEGFIRLRSRIKLSDGTRFAPYARRCPDGRVYLGPNAGGVSDKMYFVIVELERRALATEVADCKFFPPPLSVYSQDDRDNGVVPPWLDVQLSVVGPTGELRFMGQRFYLPMGE